MTGEKQTFELSRLRTGVTGLDAVLGGGLFNGSCNLVLGAAGTGKTVLGAQIAFNHVRRGGRALYMTVLTESHSRLLAHIATMAYFDPAIVGDGVYVVSGTKELTARGLRGLTLSIRRLVRERKATLLVLDGASIIEGSARSSRDYQTFVHELGAIADMLDCTVVLLGNSDGVSSGAARAIVDCLIVLHDQIDGMRAIRSIQVLKMRGSRHLEGIHAFDIDRRGMRVFPRVEAIVSQRRPRPAEVHRKLGTGVQPLDEMLTGGVMAASTTLLLGAPGSGKTLFGLSFLAAGAESGERSVYFGFYESPDRLVAKGEGVGLPLSRLVEEGQLTICWQLPIERSSDDLVQRLLRVLKRTKATRLFIDGLDGIALSAAFPERLPTFVIGLSNTLRARGVTTFISQEAPPFVATIEIPVIGVSATVENIFLLRYVEHRAHLRRLLSILKVRESSYDSSLREFRISTDGLHVEASSESAEAILSGHARSAQQAGSTSPSRRAREARGGGPR